MRIHLIPRTCREESVWLHKILTPCYSILVSCPDPTPKRGKGVWWIWTVSLVWPARWAHRHCSSETNLGSDWSTVWACGLTIYSRQWCFAFLRLVSRMTTLKLQSHWSAQIPFPGPRIVSKFTRPFSLLEGGIWGRDYSSTVEAASHQSPHSCAEWANCLH